MDWSPLIFFFLFNIRAFLGWGRGGLGCLVFLASFYHFFYPIPPPPTATAITRSRICSEQDDPFGISSDCSQPLVSASAGVCVYNILFELLLILVRFHFIPASVGACLCHRFLPITRSLGSKISNVHIVCVISYVTTKLQCLRNALHFGYTFSQLSPLDVLICACVPAGICRRQGGL